MMYLACQYFDHMEQLHVIIETLVDFVIDLEAGKKACRNVRVSTTSHQSSRAEEALSVTLL